MNLQKVISISQDVYLVLHLIWILVTTSVITLWVSDCVTIPLSSHPTDLSKMLGLGQSVSMFSGKVGCIYGYCHIWIKWLCSFITQIFDLIAESYLLTFPNVTSPFHDLIHCLLFWPVAIILMIISDLLFTSPASQI